MPRILPRSGTAGEEEVDLVGEGGQWVDASFLTSGLRSSGCIPVTLQLALVHLHVLKSTLL